MKKYSLFRVVAVITLLFTTPLCADNGQRTADEILELTGVNAQIVEIVSLAHNEVESRKELLPIEEYQRLRQLFSTTYDAKQLHHQVVTHFAQQLDMTKASEWLLQLRSPLFSKLIQLEKETASEKNLDKIIAYAKSQPESAAAESRLALIKRLDNATQASELVLDIQIAISETLLHAINPSLPSNKQLSGKQLQRILAALREQTRQTLLEVATVSYLYTYRNVSDAELTQYIEHYESPLGASMVKGIYQALNSALKTAVKSPCQEPQVGDGHCS